ncbi:hypothetical protein [Campylobacter sp.]|uniref:hypothetical protein n=1 Tax=Campylobacter sp. TaxID=205 RepID=UPI00259CE306|nr:hypothetical protein [Campylobacter sp.]MBQ8819497.1 hypothetical protein [Campylobacter sp.]
MLEKVTRKAQEKMSSLGVSTALDEEMEKLNNKANIQKAFNAMKFLDSKSIEDGYNLLQKNEKIDAELQAAQDLKEKAIESLLLDNVTEFSDFNRDKSTPVADYSLSAKWKDMVLRSAAGIPQGIGLVGDYVAIYIKCN